MKIYLSNSIYFILINLVEQLPLPLRKMMKWKMSTITPNIVKNTVIRSGFRLISSMFYF
jgi:tubulin polyglutamylase TTLL4